MSIKHTGLNKCPLHIHHSVAIAHNIISFSVHWGTSYGIMYIKLAISLLPWVINHSVNDEIHIWVISPIASLALPHDLYLSHIDLLVSARFPADTPRAWGRGHRRHYRSGSLGRALTYQTPFLPQQFWPLPSGPGNNCVITPSGHLNQGCWSSCTRTTEPSRRSHFPWAPRHGGKFLI